MGDYVGHTVRIMPSTPWLIEPTGPSAPIVACLPHGGVAYPAKLTGELAVRPDVLWSDWRTRELYDFLPELGITTVTTVFSRFVADVNRDPDGEQHGSFWSSVVPARMPTGEPVYHQPLTSAEIRHRIRLAHEPFHRTLDTAVERLLRNFPRILLLDLHSFGVPLDADIVLGDRRGATSSREAMRSATEAFRKNGFTVGINERFIGGWVIRRFVANDRVDAIQVELNQRRYLAIDRHDDPVPPLSDAFVRTKRLLGSVLERLRCDWLE